MRYVQVDENDNVIKWPFSVADLRKQGVSFRRDLPKRVLIEHGVYPVTELGKPPASKNQKVIPDSQPKKQGNRWVIGWRVRAKTEQDKQLERKRTSIPRAALAANMHLAGHWDIPTARSFAGGALPHAIEQAIVDIDTDLQARAAGRFVRSGYMAHAIKTAYSLNDEQLDEVFGV